jgi:hypothetical protein
VSSTVLGRASGCRLTIHADAAVTVGVVLANRLGLGPGGAEQEEGETLHHVDEEVLCVVLLGQPTGARRSSHPQKPVAGEKEQSCLISELAFASLAPWRKSVDVEEGEAQNPGRGNS